MSTAYIVGYIHLSSDRPPQFGVFSEESPTSMQPCVQWVQHRVHSPDGYDVAGHEACGHMDRDHRFVRLDGSRPSWRLATYDEYRASLLNQLRTETDR
jgi:hypothetical protein